MSKTMFVESLNRAQDVNAATQIIFEMESGITNKIVWQSNITKIVDNIYVDIDKTIVKIDLLAKQILKLESSIKSSTDCLFALKDSVDKLESKLRKNHFKIGDIANLLEDLKEQPEENPEEKPKSKGRPRKYNRIQRIEAKKHLCES